MVPVGSDSSAWKYGSMFWTQNDVTIGSASGQLMRPWLSGFRIHQPNETMRKNGRGNLSSALIHKVIIPFSHMMHNFRARNITSVSQQIECRPRKSSKKANIRICNHIQESSPLRSYTKREENSHPTTENSFFTPAGMPSSHPSHPHLF